VDVGIGLPSTIPDTEGRTLVDWARTAEEAGFSTLGTIGRLVYPNYEELITLSAAAAVTSRIRPAGPPSRRAGRGRLETGRVRPA
jgi:alkanesulfonate monooxygenase SsuD/methylene tetrahydromethanopterin reductase-like flavin-dependent oxidoreductase (luciferase family)